MARTKQTVTLGKTLASHYTKCGLTKKIKDKLKSLGLDDKGIQAWHKRNSHLVKDPAKRATQAAPARRRRWRPGTKALQQIRRYQKQWDLLIPYKKIDRLIREIAQDYKTNLRFQREAIQALREASQYYIVGLFHDAVKVMACNKNTTLLKRHLKTAYEVRGDERRYGCPDGWGGNVNR